MVLRRSCCAYNPSQRVVAFLLSTNSLSSHIPVKTPPNNHLSSRSGVPLSSPVLPRPQTSPLFNTRFSVHFLFPLLKQAPQLARHVWPIRDKSLAFADVGFQIEE